MFVIHAHAKKIESIPFSVENIVNTYEIMQGTTKKIERNFICKSVSNCHFALIWKANSIFVAVDSEKNR